MIQLKDTPLWRRLVIAPLFFKFVLPFTNNWRDAIVLTWRMLRF